MTFALIIRAGSLLIFAADIPCNSLFCGATNCWPKTLSPCLDTASQLHKLLAHRTRRKCSKTNFWHCAYFRFSSRRDKAQFRDFSSDNQHFRIGKVETLFCALCRAFTAFHGGLAIFSRLIFNRLMPTYLRGLKPAFVRTFRWRKRHNSCVPSCLSRDCCSTESVGRNRSLFLARIVTNVSSVVRKGSDTLDDFSAFRRKRCDETDLIRRLAKFSLVVTDELVHRTDIGIILGNRHSTTCLCNKTTFLFYKNTNFSFYKDDQKHNSRSLSTCLCSPGIHVGGHQTSVDLRVHLLPQALCTCAL